MNERYIEDWNKQAAHLDIHEDFSATGEKIEEAIRYFLGEMHGAVIKLTESLYRRHRGEWAENPMHIEFAVLEQQVSDAVFESLELQRSADTPSLVEMAVSTVSTRAIRDYVKAHDSGESAF